MSTRTFIQPKKETWRLLASQYALQSRAKHHCASTTLHLYILAVVLCRIAPKIRFFFIILFLVVISIPEAVHVATTAATNITSPQLTAITAALSAFMKSVITSLA